MSDKSLDSCCNESLEEYKESISQSDGKVAHSDDVNTEEDRQALQSRRDNLDRYFCGCFLSDFTKQLRWQASEETYTAEKRDYWETCAVEIEELLTSNPSCIALIRFEDFLNEEIELHKRKGDADKRDLAKNIKGFFNKCAKRYGNNESLIENAKQRARNAVNKGNASHTGESLEASTEGMGLATNNGANQNTSRLRAAETTLACDGAVVDEIQNDEKTRKRKEAAKKGGIEKNKKYEPVKKYCFNEAQRLIHADKDKQDLRIGKLAREILRTLKLDKEMANHNKFFPAKKKLIEWLKLKAKDNTDFVLPDYLSRQGSPGNHNRSS